MQAIYVAGLGGDGEDGALEAPNQVKVTLIRCTPNGNAVAAIWCGIIQQEQQQQAPLPPT